MPNRKRLLYFVTGLKSGGAEILVRDLSFDFRDQYDVRVVCLSFPGEVYRELKDAGIPVANLGMDSVFHVPRALLGFFRLLRSFKPDLIHTHMIHADLMGRWAKLLGIPVVATVHVKLLERPYLLWLDALTSFLVDRYIAVSEEIAQFTRASRYLPASKVMTITNGIHLDRYRGVQISRQEKRRDIGVPADAFVVGCIANFRTQKGHVYLLQAWQKVIRENQNARLVLVGWGPIEDALKAMSRRLGITDSVLFLGTRDDVPELLKVFDLFVLPSLYEGLPLTLVESMAAGCPVIATDIPENRYVLESAKAGIKVPAKDPVGLSGAIIRAIENPQSIPNQPDLRLFDWTRYIAEHKKLYGRYL